MVTIKGVARAAGVSTQTVSRVISGKGYVAAATAQKVKRAIQRLGYSPSRIASSLSSGRTLSIGMVVPNVSSPFFPLIVLGAETTARFAGYNTFLCNTSNQPEQEKDVLRVLREARVDGVILVSARLPNDALLAALAPHRAVVSIYRPIPAAVGGNVLSDNFGGMVKATTHLINAGRTRIAFMAGPENSFSAQERLRGFSHALKNAGVVGSPDWIVSYAANFPADQHTVDDLLQASDDATWSDPVLMLGRRGARTLLENQPAVEAIVCFDDQIAAGVLRACAELGRRVPDDVAVVGCNDIPLASHVTPALTTQRIPGYAMGVAAARMLLERIGGNIQPADAVFPHELIVRASAPNL